MGVRREIRGADGVSPRGTVSIRVQTATFDQQMSMPLVPGPFALGPLVAGKFDVSFLCAGHDRLSIEPFSMKAGETHQLGVRSYQQVASLRVRVLGSEGEPLAVGDVHAMREGKPVGSATIRDGRVEFELSAGSYSLLAWAPGHAFAAREVNVLPGVMTVLDVTLMRGIVCTFVLDGDQRRMSGMAWLSWRSESGGILCREEVAMRAGENGRLEILRTLAPGRYALELTTVRHAADLSFVVESRQDGAEFKMPMRQITREEWSERAR